LEQKHRNALAALLQAGRADDVAIAEAVVAAHSQFDRLVRVVGADRLKALAAQGYGLVVNLLPDSTAEYAVPGEREIVESQGLEYVHIPVDFKRPARTDFAAFAAALDRAPDQKVHIHCAANYRASAFYALYAVSRGHWSVDQAMAFIHGVWQPADFPSWPEFIADVLGPRGPGPS